MCSNKRSNIEIQYIIQMRNKYVYTLNNQLSSRKLSTKGKIQLYLIIKWKLVCIEHNSDYWENVQKIDFSILKREILNQNYWRCLGTYSREIDIIWNLKSCMNGRELWTQWSIEENSQVLFKINNIIRLKKYCQETREAKIHLVDKNSVRKIIEK